MKVGDKGVGLGVKLPSYDSLSSAEISLESEHNLS